jgi:hypothetical protein
LSPFCLCSAYELGGLVCPFHTGGRSLCLWGYAMTKTENLQVLALRLPRELIDKIDAAAASELLSRSAEVRRQLNAIYGERTERVSA